MPGGTACPESANPEESKLTGEADEAELVVMAGERAQRNRPAERRVRGAGRGESGERTLRDALLDVAAGLLVERGYRRMRMQDVADAAGVSRQTVYNEFGDKWGLAQALVIRDNASYLDGVDEALNRHDDLHSAVAAAVRYTLEAAADDPISRAVLTGEGSEELLPLLTTRAEPVLFMARNRIVEHATAQWPHLDPVALAEVADAVIRLTISHTTLPADPPEHVAQLIARLVTRYLGEPAAGPAPPGCQQ